MRRLKSLLSNLNITSQTNIGTLLTLDPAFYCNHYILDDNNTHLYLLRVGYILLIGIFKLKGTKRIKNTHFNTNVLNGNLT